MNDTEQFDKCWAIVEDEGFCDGFGGMEYRRIMGRFRDELAAGRRPRSLCLFIQDECNTIPGEMPWESTQRPRGERKGDAAGIDISQPDEPDDFTNDDGCLAVQEVLHETQKALLLLIDGKEVWVPKTQVQQSPLPKKGDRDIRLTVADWLRGKINLQILAETS